MARVTPPIPAAVPVPPNPTDPAKQVLAAATEAVAGPRQATYGDPAQGFNCTAEMWTAYLRRRGLLCGRVQEVDVAAMMALLKLSRLAASPGHADSVVDLAGYGALMACCPKPDGEWE